MKILYSQINDNYKKLMQFLFSETEIEFIQFEEDKQKLNRRAEKKLNAYIESYRSGGFYSDQDLTEEKLREVMLEEVRLTLGGDIYETNYQGIDLVLFTGGEDVTPQLYGEENNPKTGFNSERDALETKMYNAVPKRTPKLGICRGAQFLTVMNGAKLIQHVTNHTKGHTIETNFDLPEGVFQNYEMTSTHHQMMYPYTLYKGAYELIAWSTYFRSTTYLNGKDEEMELPEDFLEPEIVFYGDSNSLCIQGHPEQKVPKQTKQFIKELTDSYFKVNEQKSTELDIRV